MGVPVEERKEERSEEKKVVIEVGLKAPMGVLHFQERRGEAWLHEKLPWLRLLV